MNRGPRIGLMGPFVSRNFGDTAIQTAVIQNLRRRCPGVEIVGICTEPEDTERTHGIDAFPLAWDRSRDGSEPLPWLPWRVRGPMQRVLQWPRILGIVRGLDLLVISGGGQLDEFWGGPYRHPYLLYAWTMAARCLGVPVAAFGVGWDQVESRAGQWFCVRAMGCAGYRYVRDEGTLQFLRRAGLTGPVDVGADPAFGLLGHGTPVLEPAVAPRRFVVISPISMNAVRVEQRATHATQLEQLGRACGQWMQRGFDIRFVCTQPTMDGPWIPALTGGLPQGGVGPGWRIVPVTGVDEYLSQVSGATFVVAARLHGLILALVTGAPVIGISYSRKIARLLQDLSLDAYLFEPGQATEADLLEKSQGLLDREAALRESIRGQLHAAGTQLDAAYDSLLALATRKVSGAG